MSGPVLRGFVVALGVAALAGCGGADTPPECSFFSNVCNPGGAAFDLAYASVGPQVATVQVGGTVTFVGTESGIDAPTYQWSRSDDGGSHFVDIAGATGSSFALAGARLTDDAVVLLFSARSADGKVQVQARAVVHVSSMPPVVYQDADFAPADWATSALAVPAIGGPTHDEQQAATGGRPGPFRTMTHRLPSGASSLSVLHSSTMSIYDPATQGAIHVIDYAEDCRVVPANGSIPFIASTLLVEQAGRSYKAKGFGCLSSEWSALPSRNGFAATDFDQIAGPACAVGERCPDFTASAAPLRFGYVRSQSQTSGPAATTVHDIDNWKVSVWRN
jgi:hypothetical protein